MALPPTPRRAGHATLLCLSWLVGCAGADGARATPRRAAITDGVVDDGDPGVVGLLRAESIYCTGTLVAPRVVLTAAHCVADGGLPGVHFGAGIWLGGQALGTIGSRVHPGYDPETFHNDVALVLLAEAAPPPTAPSPLWAGPMDDSLVGQEVRIVGFGMTAVGDQEPRRKRQGVAVIDAVEADRFTIAPGPSLTCGGDSGGPTFLSVDGVEYLAGVTSSGDDACLEYGRATRVDVLAADFITPYLEATAEGSAPLGTTCLYEGHCADGPCLAASDEPQIHFCSRPCQGAPDCPADMPCAPAPDGTKLCQYPTPTPGALGSTCEQADECISGLCVRPRAEAPRTCGRGCFLGDPLSCPLGYDCQSDADDPSLAVCFASPSTGGGCCVGGDGTGPVSCAALVPLLARRSRRRRREEGHPRGARGG